MLSMWEYQQCVPMPLNTVRQVSMAHSQARYEGTAYFLSELFHALTGGAPI